MGPWVDLDRPMALTMRVGFGRHSLAKLQETITIRRYEAGSLNIASQRIGEMVTD